MAGWPSPLEFAVKICILATFENEPCTDVKANGNSIQGMLTLPAMQGCLAPVTEGIVDASPWAV